MAVFLVQIEPVELHQDFCKWVLFLFARLLRVSQNLRENNPIICTLFRGVHNCIKGVKVVTKAH